MNEFQFHGDLFKFRSCILERLAAGGYCWPDHFGSVDLVHDLYGLEVAGVAQETDAIEIESLLRSQFPDWQFVRISYDDHESEPGWKIRITREAEKTPTESWEGARTRDSILRHVWKQLTKRIW